jgi:hypothetical protein
MQQYEHNESGQELNRALNSMIWSTSMASTWTGMWHREQRERLHGMLLHRNSLITGDHTKWGRMAAIQLRDINTAMAATISLLIDRRHEQSRQKRSAERAALMGREPPDIINLHVEEDAVWTLYKRNKERRRSKHLRHEGKEALERAGTDDD